MTRSSRVFCCGNIAYDLVITKQNNKSGYDIKACPGGSIFNTALLLAKLGLDVSVISSLSEDALSENLIDIMKREKISVKHIKRDARLKTALAMTHVDKNGDPSYVFYRNDGPEIALSQERSVIQSFSDKDVFHTGSAFSYADFSFESVLNLMAAARAKKMFTTYDPNWRESRIKTKKIARSRVKKFFTLANLVKLSVSDALGITGAKTLASALKKLPEKTILTMGEKGSIFWDGKKKLACPAVKVKVIDTIGAGDAFTAGMISRYCLLGANNFWEQMPQNLHFASSIAATVCSARGATSGLSRQKSSHLIPARTEFK